MRDVAPTRKLAARIEGDGPEFDELVSLARASGMHTIAVALPRAPVTLVEVTDTGRAARAAAVVENLAPVAAWAASGAMALTGPAGGPPAAPEAPIANRINAATAWWSVLSELWGRRTGVPGAQLLAERAAWTGRRRAGQESVGGSCRIVGAGDGWLAVNLARASDAELVPAWLADPALHDLDTAHLWPLIAARLRDRRVDDLVHRARGLGIPAAALGTRHGATDPGAGTGTPWRLVPRGGDARPAGRIARVVDLTALWAGPLCAGLLARAGADVVKVESVDRLDGARHAAGGFYDVLHGPHRSVTLDLRQASGRRQLAGLIASADVVLESSRPRALTNLGLSRAAFFAANPTLTWMSISGYRSPPDAPAFGDDAAVAAGAVIPGPEPKFCADALADPVTGLYAAIATVTSRLLGGGHHAQLTLEECCRHVVRPCRRPQPPYGITHTGADSWRVHVAGHSVDVAAPASRPHPGRAPEPGEHNGEPRWAQ
ncbi:CoA transferase [Dactylosporangium roseum]|uniref:CoA transferase n=1 Tax=Dactylosporangium roseum TaxID=47989 RepID=A0ABY5Z1N3_9ACTN|nr:CoA transferase [Dactylosporangium roseum]UWZ34409.1 CoA transferase [Dactylosporangium roseum]